MNALKMETLDSGIGSRSPTPDSSHSQTNSSKVTKVTTLATNHINNNSHNTDINGSYTNSNSKMKGSEKTDAVSVSSTTIPSAASETSNANAGSGGSGSSNANGHNTSSGGNSHNNRGNHSSSNGSKTLRDYNNRRTTGYGQYKKYSNYQNNYGSYGGQGHHNYQRYNGNGHRHYGNKHYYNGNYNYHNHPHHHNYQGQGYQHHQFMQQNPRQPNTHPNSGNGNKNNNSNSGPHSHSSNQHHSNSNGNLHQHHQYLNPPSGPTVPLHRYHGNPLRNVPPHVFNSSEPMEALPWVRRGTESSSNSNWSSPNLDANDDTSTTVQTLSLPSLKNGFGSPSPQNTSPVVSPSSIDSSDTYSVQEESSSTGTTVDPALNGNMGPSPNGSSNANPNGFPYSSFHPHPPPLGYYTGPGVPGSNSLGSGRALSHQPQPPFGPNFGLLMPADSSFPLGKADSSISSSNSDKTLEWVEEGTFYSNAGEPEDFLTPSDRCSTPDILYGQAPFNFPVPGPFPFVNKKRFFHGANSVNAKLSPATQRFNNYQHRKPYHHHHLQGLPKEWIHDFDPEEYVRAFSKFGEVKERPAELVQSQISQFDSLSEEIWLKFVANQQTTDIFRKKMELWRDVSTIVRSINYTPHFRHDSRNFPISGVQVVGSTMSGFGSNTSDVDMCLLIRGSEVDQRFEAVDKLQVLNGALSATSWLDNVELIYARVPILKFRDPRRLLEVDLNCNNFVGIRNTHLLYGYSQVDWRLKPLVLLVKLWAHYHGINDAKNMTISSYSLVLMVIHFLQCGVKESILPVLQDTHGKMYDGSKNILHVKINEILPPPVWKSENNENLGNLLIQFLKYYTDFDYSENAVSVRTGGTIPIKEASGNKHSPKNDPHQWKHLCIEEPFDLTNTARSVYDRDTFDKIVGIFKVSHQRLLASRKLESIFSPISESEARTASVHTN